MFSFQPVLGLSTAASEKSATMTCHCDTSAEYGGADFRDPFAQRLNSKFSTYLTHFLLFAFPSKSYATFDNILVGLLTTIMDDLAVACKEGIMSGCGQRFYPACVGFKLDMEWMVKVGSLVRSYQNVGHVNYKKLLSHVWRRWARNSIWGCQWERSMDPNQIQHHSPGKTSHHGGTFPLTIPNLLNFWDGMLSTSFGKVLAEITLIAVFTFWSTWAVPGICLWAIVLDVYAPCFWQKKW